MVNTDTSPYPTKQQPATYAGTRTPGDVDKDNLLSASDVSLMDRLKSHILRQDREWEINRRRIRCRCLARRWQEAADSIRENSHKMATLAAGKKRPSEGQLWFMESLSLFQTALLAIRTIRKNDGNLPLVKSGTQRHLPRAFVIAADYLQFVDFQFQERTFSLYLEAIQEKESLQIAELWAMKPLLQLVLLEHIGKAAETECSWACEEGSRQESQNGPSVLRKLIVSLRECGEANWKELFEGTSKTEQILRRDPGGVYPNMDFESRDLYRRGVAGLAAQSPLTETEIACKALDLACAAEKEPFSNPRIRDRRAHIGYYLIDQGRKILESQINYRPSLNKWLEDLILSHASAFYLGGISLATFAVMAFFLVGLGVPIPVVAGAFFLLLPATESAVGVINRLTTFLLPPRRLPKLDFSGGVPADCTTMVVVPTLLLNEEHTRQMVEDLEIRYLANRDARIHFTLLTDSPDSTRPFDDKDQLVGLCSELIEALNKKYAGQGRGSFFLFHRHRVYNPAEGSWMGWERKRGKLLDLNNLLRKDFDSFPVKVGDLSILPAVRYVITLDSDTQLPKDSAHRLIGTIAHPLNRAVIDASTNTVVEGYSILQPRIGISIGSARRSRLASLYSGETGFDVYTRAVSDVYQDLFGEGSFTGKGIYEVDSFQQVLAQRFPCNALLSHDLIEGAYARTGLVSDIELIDDYPSHFSAYSRRKHRWVRGDWQIMLWLLPRVPDFFGRLGANPMRLVSRWKILDNLRRSLIEIAVFLLLLGGWFFLPGGPWYWTVVALVLMLMPAYFQLLLSVVRAGSSPGRPGCWKEIGTDFIDEQVRIFFTLAFLSHQTLVIADAIFRTIVRLTLTRKKLLEWETAAQSELGTRQRTPVDMYLDWTPLLSLIIGVALALVRPAALPAALPLICLWSASKLLCQWLNCPGIDPEPGISKPDELFLREVALRTWRFFRQFNGSDSHGLIPDNFQESPLAIARRISPTNLGLLLNARLAAYQLGYLTLRECIIETEETLNTAQRLFRHKGHFLNWYDTETLRPLEPLFISTVDSGNLAVCLWTLKQGCLEMCHEPLFPKNLWHGIRDHINLIMDLAEEKKRLGSDSLVNEFAKRVEPLGDETLSWIRMLSALRQEAESIEEGPDEGKPRDDGEIHWWTTELWNRLQAVREVAEAFAPWALSEYRALFEQPELQLEPNLQGLTLDSLPQLLVNLDGKLQRLLEQGALNEEFVPMVESLRRTIPECLNNAVSFKEKLRKAADECETLVREMDFLVLFSQRKKLLSVGYDVRAQKLEGSWYDLLASEARMATFVAIAKGDLPQESWFHLGRAHTLYKGDRVLLSWTGTMFEYLMPTLWMRSYPHTILERSLRSVVRCHQKHGSLSWVPWGISEAAHAERDQEGHYQYRCFGLPSLALKPSLSSDIVVSPYATCLALTVDPPAAIENLRVMKRKNWLGEFGFYEAADYTAAKLRMWPRYELVRCWMAHHQGMSLLALCNLLTDSSIKELFHKEPMVEANERILHEKAPGTMLVDVDESPGSLREFSLPNESILEEPILMEGEMLLKA
ncbi:MAG TPA: glucoamylase family protein [Terriglobia bacterium]|nr:glucoamylase family protein [Terriglobia bacterium]